MLGGERDRIAEAELERLIGAGHADFAFGFIGDQHHRHLAPTQQLGEMPVERGHARPRVDHHQHDIGLADRALGLLAHARQQAAILDILEPGGIDNREIEPGQARPALAPVTRDAGQIVDKRQLLADQTVEQRRLADIRPADDRGRKAHIILGI